MKKFKNIINFSIAICFTALLFLAVSFFVLKSSNTKTDINIEGVPYYEQTAPDSVGVLFRFENLSSVFLNLNYSEEKISVITFNKKVPKQEIASYGYSVDHVFDTDYVFLADFIDRFSGLELQDGDILRRYTGVQICQLLEQNDLDKNTVIAALLSKINYWGFSKNDLTFLIKNTNTELNYPTGYPLIEPLPRLCARVNFVN